MAVDLNDAASVAVEMLTKLISTTCEIFGGEVSIYETCDPEFQDDKYTVLAATTALSPKEAAQAEREWVRRVESIALLGRNCGCRSASRNESRRVSETCKPIGFVQIKRTCGVQISGQSRLLFGLSYCEAQL